MSWLSYSNDEVLSFHSEFEIIATEALASLELDEEYEWVHHLRTSGSYLVPDFVLRHRQSGHWLLALELKRTRDAVFSTRNQVQAKGYAEENKDLFRPTKPRYFAISNLEVTILHAQNGDRPPRECRLLEGIFESGTFSSSPAETHKRKFLDDLRHICSKVASGEPPEFDTVWQSVLGEFLSHSEDIALPDNLLLSEPSTNNWPIVRDYFCSTRARDSGRLLFLRCLMAEYLRGTLIRQAHPQANHIPPSNRLLAGMANTIAALRLIDFRTLFEDNSAETYRSISHAPVITSLTQYLSCLVATGRRVVDLARSRPDAPELIDSILESIYPPEIQDQNGKIQTDPELANLLAWVTIRNPTYKVLDPCCGDGRLLVAAYDVLTEKGRSASQAISSIQGIEVDAIAARLAEVRLALRQAAALKPDPPIDILRGDMFCNPDLFVDAQTVLMNPPFKRYEDQDGRPTPPELRRHYAECISIIDGNASCTTSGQVNLFNFYVEFMVKAAPVGSNIGIILDNRWYHNAYGKHLRKFLLANCEIEAIIEYPYTQFFLNWTIATSIVVLKKTILPSPDHQVNFVRAKTDPRTADPRKVSDALHGSQPWPTDWTCNQKPQVDLDPLEGWKAYFSKDIAYASIQDQWLPLPALFRQSRRGSLEKETGAVAVYEFPFNRQDYGPRRLGAESQVGFRTLVDRPLTQSENSILRDLAKEIPAEFRGRAIRNSDDLRHFELTAEDVQVHQTLEPPSLRNAFANSGLRRMRWNQDHDAAIQEMRANPATNDFIAAIETIVNLTTAVLSLEKIWNVLREPPAGELIIPRKTRSGHRVYVNPFAADLSQKQVKISSNFITFAECQAIDPDSGLDRFLAARLIAAFLISSFGQLQFEMEGYNREGLLSLEKENLARIRVYDPRWIRTNSRAAIIESFNSIPYPVSTDRRSSEQIQRNRLDRLFAEEIAVRFPDCSANHLLDEVHLQLDDWLDARQP